MPDQGNEGVSSRRSRRRQATYDEMMSHARAALAEGRPLSLRAIAADMGLTAPALYRYVDSHAELQARLAGVICDDVQERMDHAAGELDPAERIAHDLAVFRSWAHERPVEFRLIFDQGIPGWGRYDASGADVPESDLEALDDANDQPGPERADASGTTMPPAVCFLRRFLTTSEPLLQAGRITPAGLPDDVAGSIEQVRQTIEGELGGDGPAVPTELWFHTLRGWIMYCGLIRMEIDGLVPEPLIRDAGLVRPLLLEWARSVRADEAALQRFVETATRRMNGTLRTA